MESGYLDSESFIAGAKWYKRRTKLALGGEPIAEPGGLGRVYIPGLRCSACKVLLLHYGRQ